MKSYKAEIIGIDKKQFPLFWLIVVGLFLLDSFKYSYSHSYDKILLFKLSELYGRERAANYLRLFWANQIAAALLSAFLAVLLLLAAGVRETSKELAFVVVLAPVATVYGLNAELDKEIKLRRRQLSIGFCEFVSKIVLLINAGMNLFNAWERVALDKGRSGLFYKEMKATYLEIINGKPETEAYEDFAQRCRIPEISKFSTILIQNIKKGNDEMTIALRQQVKEGWDLRKSLAKTMGEEASTKLLLPMMLMFGGILLIVVTPAILVLSSM